MTTQYKPRDFGLTYEQAAHGVQAAVMFEMNMKGVESDSASGRYMKHLRTGLDLRAADQAALVGILLRKGLFTLEEYLEALRLMANEELARYTEHCTTTYKVDITFR